MSATPALRAHLDATVRAWLGLPVGAAAPELPSALARRLLRLEELEQPHRDQWGNWEFAFCEAHAAGTLWEPELDRWAAARRRELTAAQELEPLWPDGHAFAVCLTHDVDLVGRASTPAQAMRSVRLGLREEAPSLRARAVRAARPAVRAVRAAARGIAAAPDAAAIERCVELERRAGVASSYFFTVYPGGDGHRYDCTYEPGDACTFRGRRTRVSELARTLHDEGFDVGIHGSYNSALVPGLLAREKAVLEQAVGFEVTTTRQHFVHWDVRTTPRLQTAAGLRADSTLGFNRSVGFRAGTSLPFHLFDVERDEPLDLLEVPLSVHDGALLRADSLELGVELARRTIARLVDSVASEGGVASILFHPNNLEHDGYLELFRFALDHGRNRGAWFASLRDLDAWWRRREERLGLR